METEMKREREMETSLRQKTHEYETPGVVFYMLSAQFILQNESITSIIKNKEMNNKKEEK